MAQSGTRTPWGSRQADVEERNLARDLSQKFQKCGGDGLGTWKWKVENCAGTRFEDLGKMLLWATDQNELIDNDTVTTTGSKGYLAS